MIRSTRREFLANTSLAAAGLALGARPVAATTLPTSMWRRSSTTANSLLSDPIAADQLRMLATQALNAAKAAGATYADVRVAECHMLSLDKAIDADKPEISLTTWFHFGVRVGVGGAMAFAHGSIPTVDVITTAAQQAVATARGYAALASKTLGFVPATVATGEWTTPIQIDPFTVPIVAQADVMESFAGAAQQVQGLTAMANRLDWRRETRVFASTEGSLVTQTFYRSRPNILSAIQSTLFPGEQVRPLRYGHGAGGFESALVPGLHEQVKEAAETAAWMSRLPERDFDVGRFPVVCDGFTMGTLLTQTLGRALEADRVLGREADAAGGSFLAPHEAVLGHVVLNPLLTVTGDRALPSAQAAKWDDEGVVPDAFTLIKNGRVVDYCTSRATAGALSGWYQSQGNPIRSHGCAIAEWAGNPVQVRTPHLYLTANQRPTSLDDLCKDIRRGVLVFQGDGVSMDQQLSSGIMYFARLFEIQNGKLVRRIRNAALSFNTRTLWKNLAALGDVNTVRTGQSTDWKGNPWRGAWQAATTPAARFHDVDVVSTGRNLS